MEINVLSGRFVVSFPPVNPSPCKQICSPSKITRRVLCAQYPYCLDLAITRQWDGFSCGSCGDYQEEDTTRAADWQRQAECCGRLLKAVFVDKAKKGPGDYRRRPKPPMTRDELRLLGCSRQGVYFAP